MQLQKNDFDSLVKLVESYPGIGVIEYGFEGPIGPHIATAKPWPKALRKKILVQFPDLKGSLFVRRVKVVRNQ